MTKREINSWLEQSLPRYENLTATEVSILESLLRANKIDFLTVSGRTKTLDSITDKLSRKNYKDPTTQLTDLSGIRVIVYFESQVNRASRLIENSFRIDAENINPAQRKNIKLHTELSLR